jgi:uncharacterized protein
MRLDDTFEVDAPVDDVYKTILDVERVTGCVPGAELLEKKSDDAYAVGIRVKVGPITMQYRGDVEIVERDEANHRAVMKVKAREVRGQGTANATAELKLNGDGSATHGEVGVDVALSGRAASMGQGAIQDVTSKLVGRFARNLARMMEDGQAASGAPAPEAAASSASNANGSTAASKPPVEDDDDNAISAGELVGAVVVGRLKSPVFLGGLGAVLAGVAAFVLGRRARG